LVVERKPMSQKRDMGHPVPHLLPDAAAADGLLVGKDPTSDVKLSDPSTSSGQAMGHPDLLTLQPVPDKLRELSLAYASIFGQKPGASGIVPDQNPEKKQVDSDEGRMGLRNDLAENILLSLVRTGVENDFEEVVFPEYPSLREIKRLLMGIDSGAPALYAALSGSGSALFGLYRSVADAELAQQRVQQSGVTAFVTETLPRAEYWARMFAG
jgi:4-diphosphocytidyl-2-C-methyl-D-erythritol kinase